MLTFIEWLHLIETYYGFDTGQYNALFDGELEKLFWIASSLQLASFGGHRPCTKPPAARCRPLNGKTARRSFAKKTGLAALHLVTAWASENGLTLAQVACEEKSNEIPAIPELLTLLNLRGQTVTINAMGCQKEIAAQIRQQTGHYILALKGNQGTLADDMERFYEQPLDQQFAGVKHSTADTFDRGHGREDFRSCDALESHNQIEHSPQDIDHRR